MSKREPAQARECMSERRSFWHASAAFRLLMHANASQTKCHMQLRGLFQLVSFCPCNVGHIQMQHLNACGAFCVVKVLYGTEFVERQGLPSDVDFSPCIQLVRAGSRYSQGSSLRIAPGRRHTAIPLHSIMTNVA